MSSDVPNSKLDQIRYLHTTEWMGRRWKEARVIGTSHSRKWVDETINGAEWMSTISQAP
jgi:hypothetical protein